MNEIISNFSIDKKALTQIHCIILESDCDIPVVMLHEVANTGNKLDDITKAFVAETESKKLANLGREKFEEIKHQLTYYLDIAVYEREICPTEYLVEINGLTFTMASYIFEALRGYRLMFDDSHFILKSADNTARNLRSIIPLDE